jgi:hypothetical protein
MVRSAPGSADSASAPSAIKARERRRGTRELLNVLAVLSPKNAPDKPLDVSIVNVSRHGCAFRAPVPFRVGTIYSMRIGTGPLHLASTVRILACRDRADGTYDVGAKFV